MKRVLTTVSFDMRSPDFAAPTAKLYGAALEMAAYADRIGVDRIGLMEHHGAEDGYLPQPFTLAAAMAGVTNRVRFLLGAVILPLHDPVLIAEQIAITDLISNGRMGVIFGAGYVPFEFAMFRKSLKDRARLLDSGIDIILRALTGEPFEAEGRSILVRPKPLQDPRDIIMAGGGVEASARRAARFDIGFGPMKGELVDVYLAECARLDQAPRQYWRPVSGLPSAIHLCEDPDEGWEKIAPHAIHVITEYAKWAAQEGEASSSPFKGLSDPKVLRQAGIFAAMTPDQLLERVASMPDRSSFGFQPLLGGLTPDEGWKSLELLEKTLPRLRAAANAAATSEYPQ